MIPASAEAGKSTRSATVSKRASTLGAAALAVLSGWAAGLAFPPFDLHAAAWIALVPLVIVLNRDARPRRGAWTGFLAGFVANLLIFYWLWPTFVAAHINGVTTFLCWTALSALLALYWAAFGVLLPLFPGAARPWGGAAVWIAFESLRTRVLTGFPWALLSHTQAHNGPIVQTAALLGAPAVGYAVLLVNISIADLATAYGPGSDRSARRSTGVSAAAAIALVAALFGWGHHRLTAEPIPMSGSLRVAVLQGNIDQYQKWDDAYESGIRYRYDSEAREAARQNADLIIWPESAVPGWIPNQPPYVRWVSGVVSATGRPNIVGAVTSRAGVDYNAAFLVNSSGTIVAEYDKRHRVPFGEFIPFGGFLKSVVPYLGELGVFGAGDSASVFRVGPAVVAPNICYEAIFPGLVRASVRRGVNLIVNLTNDGWFLTSGAPEQHYVANIFRALENGRPVVRAANTGISAMIDPYGREIARSALMTDTVLTAAVPLPSAGYHPPARRLAPLFEIACALVAAAALGLFVARFGQVRPSKAI